MANAPNAPATRTCARWGRPANTQALAGGGAKHSPGSHLHKGFRFLLQSTVLYPESKRIRCGRGAATAFIWHRVDLKQATT